MWRFILLGVVAVAADDRWSRQASDRRQGDWVPVASPCLTCHQQQQKGRSFDQDLAVAAAGLPSVLTPPAQQNARLLPPPPPPPPDSLFQSTGFLNSFASQPPQQFNDNKPRQFLTQQNLNNRPQDPSLIRFKQNSPIPDSAGIPSNLFQVSPQQFTQQNPNQQNPQLLAIPQFNPAPFLPPPQRSPLQPFVGLNSPLLPQNLQFSDFQLPANPPVFLNPQTGNLSPQQQFDSNIFNQLPPTISETGGRFASNVTNDFKQESQNKGKEEVQLLYVPVETLRQNQRGAKNTVKNRGNKKVEPSNLNNNFDSINQPTESNNPVQAARPVFRQQNIDSGEQFFRQNQNIPSNIQDFQSQNHQAIHENAAPQIQFNQNSFSQQLFQEQTTFAQNLRNQQPDIVTSSPISNNNNNKFRFEQTQREDRYNNIGNLNNKHITFQFQHEPIQQTINPTTPKLETANQNYYQLNPTKTKLETANQNYYQSKPQTAKLETANQNYYQSNPTATRQEPANQNYYQSNPTTSKLETANQNYYQSNPTTSKLDTANQNYYQSNPTTSKLETANQNYYQSQYSNQDEYDNSQEYNQHSLGSEEQQTTIPPPHQPPLSVYMETNQNSKIGDVLTHLKNAKTIPVLDTIGPDSPQVFVGPSNLNPPSGYLKFELPYLSAIDSNRVERKVDRLPFFVAPLNFQPPPGYSKIPFPAPHIGSVVVSNATVLKAALHEKPDEYINKPETSTQNDINRYTIPPNLSPISPQLPSLVNSLQDERYFPTTEIPATTPPQTTPVYTTPHRRQHPSRGSQRTHVATTTTEASFARRPVTRQRRPHHRPNSSFRNSQVVSTTSTTPEPIVATTTNPQYEEHSEQQRVFTDATDIPQLNNQNFRESAFDSSNQNSGEFNGQQQIYNGQANYNNNQHQQQFQQQNDQFTQNQQNSNDGLQSQGVPVGVIPQLEQVQQYFTQLQQEQYLQGNQKPKQHPQPEQDQSQVVQKQKQTQYLQETYQTPNHQSDVTSQKQQNPVNRDKYFNNNNYSPNNNGFVSDSPELQTTEAIIPKVTPQTTESATPNKLNNFRRDPLRQRYRGRTQYQTTTEYATTQAEQVTQPHRVKHRPHQTQSVQIIRENKNNYQDNFPTNTERLDEHTPTERNQGLQFSNNNDNYYNNDQKQFVNIQNQNYQNRPSLNENGQFYQQQFNVDVDQDKTTQFIKNEPQFNVDQSRSPQYDKNEPNSQENDQQLRAQLENSTPYTQIKETTPISSTNIHNSQQVFSDISSKYEEHDHVTERPINQQRLVKYTRPRGSVNSGIRDGPQVDQVNHYNLDTSSLRHNNNYESQSSPSSPSTIGNNQFSTEHVTEGITESEPEQIITTTTPKPVVVRVRGRVRNRQRLNGVRQTTTTEAPNYPVGSGLETNSDSHQSGRKSQSHRLSYAERNNNNNNRHSNRFRNSNTHNNRHTNNNNNNEHSESESSPSPSTASSYDDVTESSVSTTTTTLADIPVSRRYNHLLNRNTVRRPVGNRQLHPSTTTSSPPQSGSTTRYLVRTTRRPITQVTKLSEGKARIRRPSKLITTTTTEYPPLNHGQDNFAPSAASNEVLDPHYPSQVNYNANSNSDRHHTSNYNNHNYQTLHRTPAKQFTPSSFESSTILTPTPFSPAPSSNEDDEYWNHAVTIQQSNSYDFSAESSPVTQSTRYVNEQDEYNHRSSPSYADSPLTYTQDQTPYSSNEQYVATYSKNKLKQSPQYTVTGKENRWNEKDDEKEATPYEQPPPPQQQQQQPYEEESDISNSEEEQNYFNSRQQEFITERTVLQTNYPTDTVSEQTENNKYVSHINGDSIDNYKSESIDEGQQSYSAPSVDDSLRNKDNVNSNLQGKPIDPITGKKSGKRRGAWVRVRVNKKPKDVFETAESQNLASVSNNAIKPAEEKGESEQQWNIPPNHKPTDPYSTDLPQTTSQSSLASTTTELPQTVNNDNGFKKSLTDMIKELIQEEEQVEDEEDEENKKIDEKNLEKNKTEIITTPAPDSVVTEISGTTSTIQEGLAVTVVPEVLTQESSIGGDGITTIKEVVDTEVNTSQPRVLGTSTTTEISLETEICYRGRCVKSKKNKKPLKSLFSSHRSSTSTSSLSSSDIESDLLSVE